MEQSFAESFEIWNAKVVADRGNVQKPKIKLELVGAIPAQPVRYPMFQPLTKNVPRQDLKLGHHWLEHGLPHHSAERELLRPPQADRGKHRAESIHHNKAKPATPKLPASLPVP